MVDHSFVKCNFCKTNIFLRFQMGYFDIPFDFCCPECKVHIHGIKKIINENILKINNATEVEEDLDNIDYYGDFYIRTPNFREKDKTYHRVSEFTTQEKDKLDYFKGFKTYEQLKQDMLKLYALDIYMMQLDRADVNIQLEKKDDSLRLAPVFDYSAAYMCSHKRYLEYYNYMYSMNIEKMDEVFNKYPELYNYLKQLDNVDFLKLLKQEMEKYKLNFTSTINNFYEESFSESHKLLQKIMI